MQDTAAREDYARAVNSSESRTESEALRIPPRRLGFPSSLIALDEELGCPLFVELAAREEA